MQLAPPRPNDDNLSYYIPNHAICKKKFRVVFDSSCITTSGISLNNLQVPGERLQDELGRTSIRFRINKWALTADIVAMYRQLAVNKKHWNCQRILWRPYESSDIMEYMITVVVWGMTSATFNDVRALIQCARDGANKYPLASQAVLKDSYVDDFLSGAQNRATLARLQQELTQLRLTGGFPLSKWCTNDPILAAKMGLNSDAEVNIKDESGVLGMVWKPKEDQIKLNLSNLEFTNSPCLTNQLKQI